MADMAQSWLQDLPSLTARPSKRVRRLVQYQKFFGSLLLWEPLASGATQQRKSFTVDGSVAWFEVHRLARLADNLAAKVILQSTPSGKQFSSVPHFLTHYGSGQRPTRFAPPLILPRKGIITGVADDRQTTAADNNIRLALLGAKVYARPLVEERYYEEAEPFFYPANFTANDEGVGPIAASQSLIANITVEAEADFEVEKLTIVSDGPITLQIRTAGDNWFDEEIRGELLGGSVGETPDLTPGEIAAGDAPFILPAPRLVEGAGGSGYIAVKVTDRSANSNRVEVGFWGHKLRPAGGIGGRRR